MKMKLIYTQNEDYLLPNLTIKNQSTTGINKYGYLRLHYLKENKKINHIEWSKVMDNYKNIAEEIILNEFIFI